jgi:uncharacterized damage-inducible protein DinB
MRVLMGLMAMGLAGAPAVYAQQVANPVVTSAKEIFVRQSRYMTDAAAEMPAEKYGYRPTPEQWTFGTIVSHVADANNRVCAMFSDTPAAHGMKVSETASKETLEAALKASFEYCSAALDGLQDAKLGDTISYFGGAKKPRARALIELTDDLEDHYSQMASYLRLNGLVPPSVKPKK